MVVGDDDVAKGGEALFYSLNCIVSAPLMHPSLRRELGREGVPVS